MVSRNNVFPSSDPGLLFSPILSPLSPPPQKKNQDAVPSDVFGKNDDSRTKMKNSKKTVRKLFEDSYTSGKKRWFFKKLRF